MISSSQRPLPDNTQHSQQTSMPPVGFEPTISAGERLQTYALDRAATGTGIVTYIILELCEETGTSLGWNHECQHGYRGKASFTFCEYLYFIRLISDPPEILFKVNAFQIFWKSYRKIYGTEHRFQRRIYLVAVYLEVAPTMLTHSKKENKMSYYFYLTIINCEVKLCLKFKP